MKAKVFTKMKPKAASLGFTETELQGIAAQIADNLNSEDATDEDIDAAIEAVLPYLGFGQAMATRVINRAKANLPKATEGSNAEPNLSGADTPLKTDDEPTWFKSYREAQDKRFATIENEKVITSRQSQLEAIVKDSGAFGAKTLKDFARMNFDSEEAFNDYLEETKADANAFKQESANNGLSGMGKPQNGVVVTKQEPSVLVKERIAEREAEKVAPAIVGLTQQTK